MLKRHFRVLNIGEKLLFANVSEMMFKFNIQSYIF